MPYVNGALDETKWLLQSKYNVDTLYITFHYLLKIIQKFWLVKSSGLNRHIHSVVAQIWSYDMFIVYWKHIYDIMM